MGGLNQLRLFPGSSKSSRVTSPPSVGFTTLTSPQGLAYTHRLGVSHRDLKPENLLISSLNPPLLKIADWGMAVFTPPSASLYTSCGSPHYASPQIVAGEPYDGAASDIWSCGVILYALLTGRLPFDDKNVKVLLNRVKSGKYEMPTYVHEQGQDLIRKMLVVDVEQRIKMCEIIQHPFLALDTPLVTLHPPPSLSDIARSIPPEIAFSGDIDSDTLHSLKIIWRGQADDNALRKELLSTECNAAKAFYWLLERYRERRLERYGMDDELEGGFWERVVESDGPAKPYQLVRPIPARRASSDAICSELTPLTGDLPAVSSMTSTLAAFEMIGKEGLEECSNSPKKKERGLQIRPRGPRQQPNSKTNANQGLGIIESKPHTQELSERLHAILGDHNRRAPAPPRPDESRETVSTTPGSPIRPNRIKRRLTMAYDSADKENIRSLVHTERERQERERESPSHARPRAVRPRAGTIASTPDNGSPYSPDGKRLTMAPRPNKQRSMSSSRMVPSVLTRSGSPSNRAVPTLPQGIQIPRIARHSSTTTNSEVRPTQPTADDSLLHSRSDWFFCQPLQLASAELHAPIRRGRRRYATGVRDPTAQAARRHHQSGG
jgi:serine/threonine protein kinase